MHLILLERGVHRPQCISMHEHVLNAPEEWSHREVRVAAEVRHLAVGERRIEVPAHGRVIVAWKSRATGNGGIRPLIVAFGPDGSELSRIGPDDEMDSYTLTTLKHRQ